MTCADCPDVPNGTVKRLICCRRTGATSRTWTAPTVRTFSAGSAEADHCAWLTECPRLKGQKCAC